MRNFLIFLLCSFMGSAYAGNQGGSGNTGAKSSFNLILNFPSIKVSNEEIEDVRYYDNAYLESLNQYVSLKSDLGEKLIVVDELNDLKILETSDSDAK